jgi:hypothetical protein
MSRTRFLAILVLPVACLLAAGRAGADSVVVFNEIMYHPATNEAGLEYVELYNQFCYDMDISGWRVRGGIEYDFAQGIIIPAESCLVVAASPTALEAATGYTNAHGPFTGRLGNNGEELRLRNNSGRLMDAVTYGDGGEWPAAPDGSGVSLVKIDAGSAREPPENWSWSAQVGGSPGTTNRVHQANGLAFNEVAYAAASNFWVELVNCSTGSIDLTGYVLTRAGTGAGTYVFPSRSIEAGGHVVVDESALGFRADDEDKLFLYTADTNTVVDAVVVKMSHRGRYPEGTGRWLHPDMVTTGAANSFAFNTNIVINEIMYHHQPRLDPYRESSEEWVELYNRGSTNVDLTGWKLEEGIDYTFEPGTAIAAGQYLVVARDPVALASNHPSIDIVGPYARSLSNKGEPIRLTDSSGNPADEVRYYDGGRWPEFADGRGSSLELRDPDADNSVAEAWAPSDESGKSTWRTYAYTNTATASAVGPDGQWHETVLGLLTAGEILLDDISVIENPGGGAVEFVQNGSFESDTVGTMPDKWRIIGTHRHSEVIVDPDNGANKVLRLVATGPTETMHNHAETTHAGGETVVNGRDYAISFKAKWITGSRQLHTRLYFNRCAQVTVLDAPLTIGTPGAVNRSYATNIGPTYAEFIHGPAVPAVSAPVTVSVTARDPDGVAAMTNWYCVNEGTWVASAMTDQGNGRYTATIPGQAASAIVQFYVEGRDSLGAVSTFPAAGIDSHALYRHDDGEAAGNGLHNFRVIMKDSDQTWLHEHINVMSDDRLGSTVIYNEEDIYYNTGARLKGGERGRWNAPTAGYLIGFNADRPFLGVHETVRAERSEPVSKRRREILLKLVMNHAGGSLSRYSDLVKFMAPNPSYNSVAELRLASFGDEFLDNQFDNGADGGLFKAELIYYPRNTDDGSPEGNKLPTGDGVVGTTIRDVGDDTEDYRWSYLLSNNRVRDDYTDLIPFCKVFGQGNPSFIEQVGDVADIDQWLRWIAAIVTDGVGDNYVTGGGQGHNIILYVRPEDGRTLLFPADLDYDWQWNRALVPGLAPLSKLFADPDNERRYYGHVRDIITHGYNATYMARWTGQFATLDPAASWSSYLTHIENRSNYLLGELAGRTAPEYPFQVTTAGGDVASDVVTVDGDGWIDLHEIYVEGMDEPLELTWTSSGSGTGKRFFWQANVPLEPGPNDLVFIAYDYQGNILGSDSVTFNSTVAERPLRESLKVTELMYDPRLGSDYEFIELYNAGTSTLDLAHVQITDGVTFDFGTSPVSNLAAGAYAVIVRDLAAFSALYETNGIEIAGEYEGKLDNGGEGVRIQGQWNALVLDFEYNDARGWPLAADGAGHSLVPSVLNGQETGVLDYGGNWRASAYIDGSPGRADPTPVVDVLINELAAHTDTGLPPPDDSDDWIEVCSVSNLTLTAWYLSDDADDLKQWQIPSNEVITAGTWLTFYESTGFHSNRVDGFGLNKAGEQIFLSYLPGTDQDRVADCVRFDGQENGTSWGRYPDGAEFWYAMALTPTASNRLAAIEPVISQIMYHPRLVGTNTSDNTDHEYIVIQNDATNNVELWNAVGPWRINGIGYTLPSNTVIGAGEALTIVPFDPADALAVSNFLATHNLLGTLPVLLGPHDGTLSNTGERLALERPQAPDAEGESISWVTVDEVIYSSAAPWPDASANGAAIHRIDLRHSGNDPLNWTAQPAALDRPKIMLTSPWTGSTMFMPFSHTATAIVNDDKLDGALQHVEFFLNGTQSIGTDTAAPFEAVIDHTLVSTAGTYTVHADVVDDGGSESSVAAVFTADFATRVGIGSPTNGTSVLPPFTTDLVAWVDNEHVVGAVTLTFLNGTNILGVDGTAPYEVAIDQTDFPASGTFPLYAVLDDDFASSTSGVSFLTVELLKGLPFVEDFEGYAAGSDLDGQDPDGSHPWAATDVVVTNSPVRAGSRSAALTSETAVATQTFNDGRTDVWTDLYIRPVFASDDNASVTNLPAGSSFAFYVGTNGQVVAYDGTTATQLMHTAMTEGEWVRFSVHSDYAAKQWALYMNGVRIAADLGFCDIDAAAYTEFGVRGAGSSHVPVDSITIDTNAPALNAAKFGTVVFGR